MTTSSTVTAEVNTDYLTNTTTTAFIVGDSEGSVQKALLTLGLTCLRHVGVTTLVTKHAIDREQEELRRLSPTILLIQPQGTALTRATVRERKMTEGATTLALAQLEAKRHLLLVTPSGHAFWSFPSAQLLLTHRDIRENTIFWCSIGMRINGLPTRGSFRVASNMNMPTEWTNCCGHDSHTTIRRLDFNQQYDLGLMILRRLLTTYKTTATSEGKAESINKTLTKSTTIKKVRIAQHVDQSPSPRRKSSPPDDDKYHRVTALLADDGPNIDEDDYQDEIQKHRHVEEHYDDCGDDTTSLLFHDRLDEHDESPLLPTETIDTEDILTEYICTQALGPDYIQNYLRGSDYDHEEQRPRQPTIIYCNTWNQLHYHMNRVRSSLRKIHVVEFCGGTAGVSKLCIRIHLSAGRNFDLVCGIDLTSDQGAQNFIDYVTHYKPTVIVGSPPCTSNGGWSRLNRYRNPDQWAEQRQIGRRLSQLLAHACWLQYNNGRHWIVENPYPSDLWEFSEWQELFDDDRTTFAIHDQCTSGLMNVERTAFHRKTTGFRG